MLTNPCCIAKSLACLVLLLPGMWLGRPAVHARVDDPRPNIILINLDDADVELLSPVSMFARYPNLSLMVSDGMQFTNLHVTTPLCGPSRAALLRAQYAHRTQIKVNTPAAPRANGFGGGMQQYFNRGFFDDDLSTWIKDAGYRTMLVGKFLHGDVIPFVPPGWDDFYSARGADYFGAFRFTNRDRPEGRPERDPLDAYRTNVESQQIRDLLERHFQRPQRQPFFLYYNPLAPHKQAKRPEPLGMVAPEYEHWWPQARMPRSLDFDERNFNDKSSAIAHLERLTERRIANADKRFRERILSMKSVDDLFGELIAQLQAHEELGNTYIFLTSDNGYQLGHHRMFGKGDSFVRSCHVPLYVWGPGIPGGTTANHLLAHIDIAPTITELAGGNVPGFVDGRSFAQLIFDPESEPEDLWRESVLIENWESRNSAGQEFHAASKAIRMYESVYTEWADGTPEYYDLVSDRYQVFNSYRFLPEFEKAILAGRLRALVREPTPPRSTITQPFVPNELQRRQFKLRGFAEDDMGIERVVLTIIHRQTGHYWNGVDWQAARVRVLASMNNSRGQITTWTYDSLPTDVPSPDDRFSVLARAYDVEGNFESDLPKSSFGLDYQQPESIITAPVEGETVAHSSEIVGFALDARPIKEIRLVIKQIKSGLYWNGASWQPDWQFVTATIDPTDNTWSYPVPVTSGNIYVASRAVDDSNNIESEPFKRRFSVQP